MKKVYLHLIFSMLFLLPVGAQPVAELVDEFTWLPCEHLRSKLDNFLAELSNSPDTMGFVYIYEGKYEVTIYGKKESRKEVRLPVFGEAAHRTNIFRTHFGYRKFDPNRYLFIDGGIRDFFTVQMWIVPKGVSPPPAKPTVERMKYRKGKFEAVECP